MAPVWRKRFVAPEIACHRQRRPALAATDWTAWRDWIVWRFPDRLVLPGPPGAAWTVWRRRNCRVLTGTSLLWRGRQPELTPDGTESKGKRSVLFSVL